MVFKICGKKSKTLAYSSVNNYCNEYFNLYLEKYLTKYSKLTEKDELDIMCIYNFIKKYKSQLLNKMNNLYCSELIYEYQSILFNTNNDKLLILF